MRRRAWAVVAVALAAASACNDPPVADKHTSLASTPVSSPGKPKHELSLLWLHHGCTEALLHAGLAKALADNRTPVVSLLQGEGKVEKKLAPAGAPLSNDRYVIGDHTRPAELAATFASDALLATVRRYGVKKGGAPHRVIVLNSCHGTVRLPDDAAVARVKKAYGALLGALRRHQDVLFVVLTMPPLTRAVTDKHERKRARSLATWLAGAWGQRAPNVRVFDLFDALAVRPGHALANALAPQFAQSARDPRPTKPAAAHAVARLFVPWLDLALKTRGL